MIQGLFGRQVPVLACDMGRIIHGSGAHAAYSQMPHKDRLSGPLTTNTEHSDSTDRPPWGWCVVLTRSSVCRSSVLDIVDDSRPRLGTQPFRVLAQGPRRVTRYDRQIVPHLNRGPEFRRGLKTDSVLPRTEPLRGPKLLTASEILRVDPGRKSWSSDSQRSALCGPWPTVHPQI